MSDGLVASLPLMVAWISLLDSPPERPEWLLLAAASGQTLALFWRRRFPLTVLLVVITLEVALIQYDMEILVGFIAAAAALGTWGAPLARRTGLAVGLVVLAIGMVGALSGDASVGYAVLGISSVAVMFVGFLLSGRLGARQRGRIRELDAYTRRLEAEREHAEQRAAERERALLARELHDILNHSVTAMVLDAQAAAETGDQAETQATLRRVARTGRSSLAELRRLLGVLRRASSDTDHDELLVPSGLDQLDELVRTVPASGPRIRLVREGVVRPVDASVEQAAYRVVQESVTNVAKHAGAVDVLVSLTYSQDQLVVRIRDAGSGAPRGSGTGLGLIGMRERVELVGGTLTAGPRPDGGFEVAAYLPARSAG